MWLLKFLWYPKFLFLWQLLNVYVAKYHTGGEFWPTVHNCTIFSLVLMHIIVIGIFGLKKLPLASALILPLPILTLLFNEYCRKRFFPIFKAYPTEVWWLTTHSNLFWLFFFCWLLCLYVVHIPRLVVKLWFLLMHFLHALMSI